MSRTAAQARFAPQETARETPRHETPSARPVLFLVSGLMGTATAAPARVETATEWETATESLSADGGVSTSGTAILPETDRVAGNEDAIQPVTSAPNEAARVETGDSASSGEPSYARGGWGLLAKGAFDRAVAGVLLLMFALPMALIALAVRLSSPGPAVFRQTRVGRGGREFTIYKFRSMVPDAELLQDALADQNEGAGLLFKMKRDPRVTPLGSVLRTTSLDELPQLWNVLRGDMSLVGPRPSLPHEVAQYGSRERSRLAVKPGITGLWQVSGRSQLDWETSIALDLRYVSEWSLLRDLLILLRTVSAVLRRDGAM